MGFLSKIKDAFAHSAQAQFLGGNGALIVLHSEFIEKKTADGAESFDLDGVTAALSAAGDTLTVSSEKFEWSIPVGVAPTQANAAALFVNQVNTAAQGPHYSVETFVHGK